MKKNTVWRILTLLVPLIIVLAYTPLFIPVGVYMPKLLGLPYTLWTSMLLTVVLVALTMIGAKYHPGNDEGEEEG